jgi:EAL domain-containing protein (putative c-di-GMP-specific phosphodiesterase class I)
MIVRDLMAELRLWFGATTESVDSAAVSVQRPPQSNGSLCFVVDDEAQISQLISAILKPLGVEVREFPSAQSLLEGLDGCHPQLVFLDISLQGSDAVEALHGMAKAGYSGGVHLMSGRHGSLLDDIKKIGERQGLRMLSVLPKPFDVATVRRVGSAAFTKVRKRTPHVSIDEALQRGWLTVWYQPKINLKQKLLVGCEALARIEHPEYGMIAPGGFLPGADIESLCRLTRHVLITVLRDCVVFAETGAVLRPAVNIPAEVLLRMPVASIVREYRPNAEAWRGLIVEVTEDQIVRDIDRAQDIATQLQIYDIALSIDDFGAGYSSLARLKHFPFAELKLDMSFVQNCATNTQNAAICKAAIDLAHSFNAIAVAEGVEKLEDLRALYKMGCDVGQGYLFAKPMPLEKLVSVLKRGRAIEDLRANHAC